MCKQSIETINKSIPPATMKLNILIPNIERSSEPAIAKIINNSDAIVMAFFVTRFFFSIPMSLVNAIKRGTLPIEFTTISNDITDFNRSFMSKLEVILIQSNIISLDNLTAFNLVPNNNIWKKDNDIRHDIRPQKGFGSISQLDIIP
jgi:hypothetical protein